MNFYVAKDGESLGPYNEAQLREYVRVGVFSTVDLGCKDGTEDWETLDKLLPPLFKKQPSAERISLTTENLPQRSATPLKVFTAAFSGMLFAGGVLLVGWHYFSRSVQPTGTSPQLSILASPPPKPASVQPSLEDRARKRALALDTEILRIKREGINVESRVAKAKLNDALAALAESPQEGDQHTVNANAAEAARQAAIDAWVQDSYELVQLVRDRHLVHLRAQGENDAVKTAETRLWEAQQRLAISDRAQSEKTNSTRFSLPDPTEPREPSHPLPQS